MKQPGKGNNRKRKQESLKEKVRRHLTDKNDVITDEDIRNVVVGSPEGEKEFRISEDDSEAAPPNNPNKQRTSWDNLSEGYD